MEKREKAFLEVKDLWVEYSSGDEIVHAVNGVSFSLGKGRTLGLVGETGAGKTTIAKSILRILPEPQGRVVSGVVNLAGQDILSLPEQEMMKIRGEKISMIFQDPMTALNPVQRVGDQIAEAVRIHSNSTVAEASERAGEMLELVGIPKERSMEYPHQFSGGMKQRVVIAMALACNPALLLADEPTTALDVTIQAQVLELINEIRNNGGLSMILITHDLGVVAKTCDDVAVVYAGQIVEVGSKEEVFDHPRHPYTIGLFHSLPDIEMDTERLQPINGNPPDPVHLPSGCSFHPRCSYCVEKCKKEIPGMSDIGEDHWVRCFSQEVVK